MKVLVATSETNGDRKNDFCFTEELELVHLPLIECDSEEPDGRCGCKRAFCGLNTHRATTTAQVVDLNIDDNEYLMLFSNGLKTSEWEDFISDKWIQEEVTFMLDLANKFDSGTIVGRCGDAIISR